MKNLFKNKLVEIISFLAIIIAGGGWIFFNVLSNGSDNTQSVSEKETITVQTKKVFPESITQDIPTSAIAEPFEKVEVFPEFDMDRITINVIYPGGAPEEVEQNICILIEEHFVLILNHIY